MYSEFSGWKQLGWKRDVNMGVGSWDTWAALHRTGSWEPWTGSTGKPQQEHDPSVSPCTNHCLALPYPQGKWPVAVVVG